MQNNINSYDLKEQCKNHMAEHGLALSEDIISDEKFHRYSADENQQKKDEWYVAHEGVTSSDQIYLNTTYGSWSTGARYTYNSYKQALHLSEYERTEFKRLAKQNRIKTDELLKEKHDQAAKKAKELWGSYSSIPPSDAYTRYEKIKGIEPIGLKYGKNSEGYPSVVIPLTNLDGEIRSLQYISQPSDSQSFKRFLYEGEKKGNFHILGDISKSNLVYITEGYATAVSVYMGLSKSKTVVIAFDAGNLKPVAENLRSKYTDKHFVIAGDKDSNDVGVTKAKEAASWDKCIAIFPEFNVEHQDYNDFNDVHQLYGLEELFKQITNLNFIKPTVLDTIAETHNPCDPCEQFRLSKLPRPLAEYISTLSKTTNAHPIMITASVLIMISAFLGRKVYIKEGADGYFQKLHTNLWILCITKSGQFKTTALNKGANIGYLNQAEVLKDIKRIQNELKHAEKENNEPLVSEMRMRALDNVILPTKTTAEGFLEYLSHGQGGAVFASEFGAVLQNLDKTHNNDFKATLTEFFDVPKSYRYKTKTQGDYIIEEPYISICGVSTMPWIEENLRPSDIPSGFFARFMLFTPQYDSVIPPALPRPLNEDMQQAEDTFRNHLNDVLQIIQNERSFKLDHNAKKKFEKLHQLIYTMPEAYSDRAKEIMDPYLKRWSPYLLKLAMIMQLFINPKSEMISEAAIDAAWNVLLPAMKSTAALFEGSLGESKHQRKSRELFEWISKKVKATGKPIKRQTIMTSKKLSGKTKEYDEVLDTLIEEGKLEFKPAAKKNDSLYSVIEHPEE